MSIYPIVLVSLVATAHAAQALALDNLVSTTPTITVEGDATSASAEIYQAAAASFETRGMKPAIDQLSATQFDTIYKLSPNITVLADQMNVDPTPTYNFTLSNTTDVVVSYDNDGYATGMTITGATRTELVNLLGGTTQSFVSKYGTFNCSTTSCTMAFAQ